MLIPCKILRSFPYSVDGFTTLRAEADMVEDIPAVLVEGLEKEGYLTRMPAVEAKAVLDAPENKEIRTAPENKFAAKRGGKG